jgi:hypothetical protein
LVFPPCVAWIEHVPALTSVTVTPDIVQTAVVVEAKLTAKPELALALTVNAAVPNTRLDKTPKLMLWLSCVTWKLWLTGTAAA